MMIYNDFLFLIKFFREIGVQKIKMLVKIIIMLTHM